ncbi:hypothetical protein PR202_ga00574 [Eleusine coracana subsp. coracana]|uniref:Uncharacterized protein n=1 Tax=Eleusine coracana subsp. coracana TaxID=191504 RepID=A0AAV5BGW3_ELECO|nr:hypothetical protein PR202_ga00574 [Eleusine coracana subsp. coracana]
MFPTLLGAGGVPGGSWCSRGAALELPVGRVHLRVAIHSLRQRRSQGPPLLAAGGRMPPSTRPPRDMYEWITGVLASRGGTFTFRGPWFTNLQCVVTADPRNLEHLLKTRFGSLQGPLLSATPSGFRLSGDGIFGARRRVCALRARPQAASLEFTPPDSARSRRAPSSSSAAPQECSPSLAHAEASGNPLTCRTCCSASPSTTFA